MAGQDISKASLRDFLHVLFKRKKVILGVFFLAVGIAAASSFMLSPVYEAQSQVLVKVGRENLYLPPGSTSNPVVIFDREEQINSEVEMIKGRMLAQEVVENIGIDRIYPGLAAGKTGLLTRLRNLIGSSQTPLEQATVRFEKAISVEAINKSRVIEIRFDHENPQIAALVINTLIGFYLNRHLQVHKNPEGSHKFFEQQAGILQRKLQDSENALKDFKERNNITSATEEKSLLLGQQAQTRALLDQTRNSEVETNNRIAELQRQLAETPENIPQGVEAGQNLSLISALEANLVELELKEKQLLTKYTDQSLMVQNARQEIALVKQKLAEQESKRYGNTRTGINTTYQLLNQKLLENEAELNALRAKKKSQMVQVAAYNEQLGHLNETEVELNRLQEQVLLDRENYRLYLAKFEEARISEAMDSEKLANVSLMEPALPPIKPIRPKPILNLLLGMLIGGFCGLSMAFILENLDDSLESPEDVERELKLPVLASIPLLK